ncbi:MAG: adenylyl-sulfate kinase [Planctomycetes bacterium]|jgi:adenylyl-sulfate kinase|nr:adenylyl-sulfate kinase [Planctomycetota bacterium]MBT4029276.1 adenylyl-sulfate kinase [Planctomycetota bacterium]MBT4560451.1 adenylyl-sulfate kinase [Planctomycetota bacterium]MBT5101473.1 adenylyl-sulfate kinase [Planctomycetota bacterium]MBT5120028.1 adenylyl-sulfate kinase [Planctomycetota bacterium]
MEHKGFVLWFTGLSGSGKSTISRLFETEMRKRGASIEILDGDEVRENLSKGLGFSKEDRDTNIRRIGYVAKLLARNGAIAVTAAISPYAEVRDQVRRSCGRFVEVYAECSIEELCKRDVKGLYAKALSGEIKNFTGISDPYEAPENAEIVVNSETQSAEESTAIVIEYLEKQGLIKAAQTA